MTISSFYDEPESLGNKFGVPGPFYGPKGHLGVDWVHPSGTPIPSWTEGVVVTSTYYDTLGNTVILRRPDGRYAGFCHMRSLSPLGIGAAVRVGDIVGRVGSSGTSTTGPHLHATLEPRATIGTQNAIDPLPYIRDAVNTYDPSGGGSPTEKEEDEDMKPVVFTKTEGGREWSLVAPWLNGPSDNERGYILTADPAVAVAWQRMYMRGDGSAYLVERAGYIAVQAQARVMAEQWQKSQGGPGDTVVNFPKGFTGTFA